MSDADLFNSYIEALNALSTVELRQRAALRKAVEVANSGADEAKARMASQQRMYARAGQEAQDAERLLRDLCSILRSERPTTNAPTPQAGEAPPLSQIRNQITEVRQWATDTRPTAESLLRTAERLNKAQKAIAPTPLKAAPVVQDPRKKSLVGAIGVLGALVVIVIVFVVLITH